MTATETRTRFRLDDWPPAAVNRLIAALDALHDWANAFADPQRSLQASLRRFGIPEASATAKALAALAADKGATPLDLVVHRYSDGTVLAKDERGAFCDVDAVRLLKAIMADFAIARPLRLQWASFRDAEADDSAPSLPLEAGGAVLHGHGRAADFYYLSRILDERVRQLDLDTAPGPEDSPLRP